MPLILSDETLTDLQMSAEEVKLKIAIWLYLERRISIGKAAKLAGMNRFEFQQKLTAQKIPSINYGINEIRQELKSLSTL